MASAGDGHTRGRVRRSTYFAALCFSIVFCLQKGRAEPSTRGGAAAHKTFGFHPRKINDCLNTSPKRVSNKISGKAVRDVVKIKRQTTNASILPSFFFPMCFELFRMVIFFFWQQSRQAVSVHKTLNLLKQFHAGRQQPCPHPALSALSHN